MLILIVYSNLHKTEGFEYVNVCVYIFLPCVHFFNVQLLDKGLPQNHTNPVLDDIVLLYSSLGTSCRVARILASWFRHH